MRIITHQCPNCETIVAANELEDKRIMKCPGSGCEEVLRFTDLSTESQSYYRDNRNQYRLD